MLTKDQAEAIPILKDWWKSKKQNIIIKGMPGTGKTYLVKYLVESLGDAIPLYTAPTNEAVRQLELSLGNKYSAKTTYSALGLTLSTRSFKQHIYQKTLPQDFYDYNLMIIDEASMAGLGKEETKDLINYVNLSGIRCIWLGDWAQLPPINSVNGESPIFNLSYEEIELNEVKRHSGDILEWSLEIRKILKKHIRNLPTTDYKTIKKIRKENSFNFKKQSIEEIINNEARILVWTNQATKFCPRPGVKEYNDFIRNNIFGEKVAAQCLIHPTDKILFSKPLFHYKNYNQLTLENLTKKEFSLKASVNTKAEVLKVTLKTLLDIECYYVEIEMEYGKNTFCYIPTKEGSNKKLQLELNILEKAKQETDKFKKSSLFHYYHTFKGVFTEFKYTYCITGHRAQGSTIPKVYVDTANILQNKNRLEAFKNLYVCATRAQNELILFI